MSRPILVAVDDSPRAAMVLGAAGALAQKKNTSLIILRVVPPPMDIPAEAMTISPAEVTAMLVDDALAKLMKLRAAHLQNVESKAVAQVGMPWESICEKAKQSDAQLIVMGSHGYDGFDRILGTTAQKVVNNADRSVLVVRSDPPWTRIVCALDGASSTHAVFEAATHLSACFAAELTLLRAVIIPKIPNSVLPKGVNLEALLFGAATAHAATLQREAPKEMRVHTSVHVGDAREVIKREAAHASCVVMGAHGYNLRERFLGTTAAWVVNHLPSCVLVVREPNPNEAITLS